jgi:hypothetical protein
MERFTSGVALSQASWLSDESDGIVTLTVTMNELPELMFAPSRLALVTEALNQSASQPDTGEPSSVMYPPSTLLFTVAVALEYDWSPLPLFVTVNVITVFPEPGYIVPVALDGDTDQLPPDPTVAVPVPDPDAVKYAKAVPPPASTMTAAMPTVTIRRLVANSLLTYSPSVALNPTGASRVYGYGGRNITNKQNASIYRHSAEFFAFLFPISQLRRFASTVSQLRRIGQTRRNGTSGGQAGIEEFAPPKRSLTRHVSITECYREPRRSCWRY